MNESHDSTRTQASRRLSAGRCVVALSATALGLAIVQQAALWLVGVAGAEQLAMLKMDAVLWVGIVAALLPVWRRSHLSAAEVATGYALGSVARIALAVALPLMLVHREDAGPLVAVLGLMFLYLPLMFVEATLVANHLRYRPVAAVDGGQTPPEMIS